MILRLMKWLGIWKIFIVFFCVFLVEFLHLFVGVMVASVGCAECNQQTATQKQFTELKADSSHYEFRELITIILPILLRKEVNKPILIN